MRHTALEAARKRDKENRAKQGQRPMHVVTWSACAILTAGVLLALFLRRWPFEPQPFLNLANIAPPHGRLLKQIAVPRPAGSTGSARVREVIKQQFNPTRWTVEEDVHTATSPIGPLAFTNLIMTLRDIPQPGTHRKEHKRVVLAAHYDSKLLEAAAEETTGQSWPPADPASLLESSGFVGATDSAWSCALIIELALAIEREVHVRRQSPELMLQVVLFDGEEAVREWSSVDSLYGARHLAEQWAQLDATSSEGANGSNALNRLQNINLFMLLDLLGARTGNRVFSFHSPDSALDRLFSQLIRIEQTLFPTATPVFRSEDTYKHLRGQGVEDDHTPFQQRGVPVLHLIPVPFPDVWHKFTDTIDALDPDTCHRIALVLHRFLQELLISEK